MQEKIKREVSIDYLFERDHTGIWVFGDPVIDYVPNSLQSSMGITEIGNNIQFNDNLNGIKIIEQINANLEKIVAQVNFPLKPDNASKPTYSPAKGGKYSSNELINGQNYLILKLSEVQRIVGGGGHNMSVSLREHSPDGIIVSTALRPESEIGKPLFPEANQTLDMYVIGANQDPGNIIISNLDRIIFNKIVSRGADLYGKPILPFEAILEHQIGTYVLNSSKSPEIIKEFFEQYALAKQVARMNGQLRPLEVICLTSKMSDFYDSSSIGISRRAVNDGALLIFNTEEAIKYGLRKEPTNPALSLPEKCLEYADIILSLKNIRQEQRNKQSVYVTLGEYGCIAMDEHGDIYRTNSFDITNKDIKSTNGAGDRMASMITAMENEKAHTRNYHILDIMSTATATACTFIQGKGVAQDEIKKLMASQTLGWEYLGKADRIEVTDSIYAKKIGFDSITENYNEMIFR
jgi:hypothetical protein